MARASLVKPTIDLVSDDGTVLWSIVRGEQLEQIVNVNFLTNTYGYEYEAVVVEGNNVVGATEPPDSIAVGAKVASLNVRVPIEKPEWNGSTAYDREDIVPYLGKYYRKLVGNGVIENISPDTSPNWAETKPNLVYIQIPSTLGSDWALQPAANSSTYGFFELRVTEPAGSVFRKTWKPVRGVIKLDFSPTELI